MKRLALFALAGLLAGCAGDKLASPFNADSNSDDDPILASRFGRGGYYLPPPSAPGIRVMTYNVYLGTNLNPVIGATNPQDFLLAAVSAYSELQQTNFPARAGKIADQIAEVRPDLLGLEEAALWSVSAPYAGGGPPTAPFVTQYDFLKLVIDSLKARHLHYIAASVDTTTDVAAPVPTGFDQTTGMPTGFALVRFQDRDAVLVRTGIRFRDPQHARYAAYIPLTLLDGTQTGLYRGWSSVRANVDGREVRFVATHLEAENGQINYLQAQELLGLLQDVHEPVIWVGDFNSGPGVTSDFAPTYDLITGAGFTDLWTVAHPGDPGLTNGPNDGVGALNQNGVLVPYPTLDFTTRVDLVLLRERFGTPHRVHAAVLGNRPNDRTSTGLWPSDHATVGMVFELPVFFAHWR